MNVLFIGLGSIGTRHLRNLTQLAKEKDIPLAVHALRSDTRQLPDDVASLVEKQIFTYEQLSSYDVAFITNPTNLHYKAMRAIKDNCKAFFIEKPIFEHSDYVLEECIEKNMRAYVAAPMRYCKTFIQLKKLVDTGIKPYCARVICSSYLPDWRKGVDYRKVYSAHKEMGGGVTIDLIHEWDYMVDLFGFPTECFNFKGQYSSLELNSDDLSVYIARYPSMLAEIHLDYFGRVYRRTIELFCEGGTITADFGKGTVTTQNGTVINCEEDVNERYLRELDYFLSYLTNTEESTNSPQKALKVLKLTLA